MDKDGYITAEELIKVIDKVGGVMSPEEARGLIRKVNKFLLFPSSTLVKADSDKNGSIDYTEFSGLWSSLKGEEEVGWGPETCNTILRFRKR